MSESKVLIIGMSDTGEAIPAASGRISTQAGTATEIFEKSVDNPKNPALIGKITRSGHNSVLEHTVYNMAFENVSVFCEQFIIEFRLASFTVKSRRYVDFADAGFYTPSGLEGEAAELYDGSMRSFFADYSRLLELGIPKEDARFVLPYCLYSNFFCTANARELLRMIDSMLRGRGSAFPELRAIGESLLAQMTELTPGIAASLENVRRHAVKGREFPRLDLPDAGRDSADGLPDVELLSCTPDADMCVARSCLAGYAPMSAADTDLVLGKPDNVRALVDWAVHTDRARALECVNCTFAVRGVSLSTLTHFTRHRMQSLIAPGLELTDRSTRIMPESVKNNETALGIYADAFLRLDALYKDLLGRGVPYYDLVYCQLSGNTVDIVITMNARELRLFFALRTCSRAQWEIRRLADLMLTEARRAAPGIFNCFGPSCYTFGECPEGAMTCGRAAEMRKKYSAVN